MFSSRSIRTKLRRLIRGRAAYLHLSPGGAADATLLSAAAHALALGILLYAARARPVRVVTLPGSAAGTHLSLVYLPGRAPVAALVPRVPPHRMHPAAPLQLAASTAPARESALALHAPPRPHLTLTPPLANTAPAPPGAGATPGSDALGDGDMQIALTTYSPSPQPDLSALPGGLQGEVVLDVTIDPTGKVADLAVLHTLGYGIEATVLSTVRTWTFRPATRDGVPVASVQELHFHYGRRSR